MTDRELELAEYAALAPRMVIECVGCYGKGFTQPDAIHGDSSPSAHAMIWCSTCRGSGKAMPLMEARPTWGIRVPITTPLVHYGDAGGIDPIVPLALLLETAARMGLWPEMELSEQEPPHWQAEMNGIRYDDGLTPTLAVLRAIKAALDVRK